MTTLSDIKAEPKVWTVFEETDPFNGHRVVGYISHRTDNSYGAMFIHKVNGVVVPQLIYCTPKMTYPFDRAGRWQFPKAKRILRYEKLDGTNVFGYRYKDDKGNTNVAYKTRLNPFLRKSRFGDFLGMWQTILKAHPEITKTILMNDVDVSFELWGSLNPIWIQYDTPLNVSFLFVRKDGKILPPEGFDFLKDLSAPYLGDVTKDYIWNYQGAQKEASATLGKSEEGLFTGREGEIWYLEDHAGNFYLFKCKPEEIELAHWSAGGLQSSVIEATVYNTYESTDIVDYEAVKTLLLEEFDELAIEKVRERIEKIMDKVRVRKEFRADVESKYRNLGISLLIDKGGVMREMSRLYPKAMMQKVFTQIAAIEGIEK